MATAKLRRLTNVPFKSLLASEIEILEKNFFDIEKALQSVGAVTPGSTGSSPITIPIRHDQLLELGDDDHLQYLLLAGRAGGQTLIWSDISAAALTIHDVSSQNGQLFRVRSGTTDLISVRGAGPSSTATVTISNNVGTTDPALRVNGRVWISDDGGIVKIHPNSATIDFTSTVSGDYTFDKGLFTTKLDLSSVSSNITAGGANAKRTLLLMCAGGKGTSTAGCGGPTQIETSTNKNNYWALEFDSTTEENAFWNVQMPDNWDGSTITARFIWTNAAGLTTETVRWGIKARAYADDGALDQAFGTEVTVDDTWLAQGDVHVSAATSAITVGGSPAGGQYVIFNIARKTASDNLTGDARLLGIQIEYGINSYGD